MRRLLCVIVVALTGCAGGPAAPPPPADISIQGDAMTGPGALALSVWRPEGRAHGVMLALHGFGDYGPSTFGEAAAYWADRGWLVYAYDQRGFGRNPSRGRWPGAARLVEDAVAVAAALRARWPGLPLVLIGHSMGGGVALAAAPAVRPDGLVLAAPAVWGGEALALPYRALAWAGALLLPDKRWTGEGIVRIQASDNIPMLRGLGRDPLILGQPSSREFMGLIRLMDRAVAAAPDVRAPTLTLYGLRDQVTPRAPVMALQSMLGGPKRLVTYPEGWHMLLRDLQARRVWRDVADWADGLEDNR